MTGFIIGILFGCFIAAVRARVATVRGRIQVVRFILFRQSNGRGSLTDWIDELEEHGTHNALRYFVSDLPNPDVPEWKCDHQ